MPNRVAANNIITDYSIVYCIVLQKNETTNTNNSEEKKSGLSTINIESVRMYYYIKPPLPLDFNCVFPIFSNRIQEIAI